MSRYKTQLSSLISKYQKGDLILNPKNFDQNWYGDYTDKPNFKHRDIPATAERWKYLSNLYDQDTTDFDLTSQDGINKLADVLQNKGLNEYNSVASDYAMNMAPTRDGLRNLIENGVFTTKELKDMGVKMDSKDMPILGVDEIEMSEDKKAKIVGTIQDRLSSDDFNKFKKSYESTNFNDGKGYHRFFEIRDVKFDNDEELQKFAKDRGFTILDKDKGIYKTDKTGAYVRLFSGDKNPETPQPATPTSSNPQTESGAYENKPSNFTNQLPILTPDQSTLPPRYFGTRLQGVRAPWNVANFVSPEASIREINRQSESARQLLASSNPYTSAAAIANVQAQENESIGNAVYQTEIANQQAQNQADAINEQRVMSTDAANAQEAAAYENRSNVGLDNYYKEYLNYIDRRNEERQVNYNLQNQVNAINATNPNYNIGNFGQIYQTGEDFKVVVGEGGDKFLLDRDGKMQKVVTETKKGNTKTTTTVGDIPKRKEEGGLITSGSLAGFLNKRKKS